MIERSEIDTAASRIAHYVRETPIMTLPPGDVLPHHTLTLKLEHLQHTASFKARGAFNAMLSSEIPESGVIAASGGNHGAAVAYAAQVLGHRAEIFVPSIIAPAKRERLERYGAIITTAGDEFQDALDACMARQMETGACFFHAYDQPEILAGQGTVAREFQHQSPAAESVLIAVGGGGLIGGMASWYRGAVKVIAVEGEGTHALNAARAAGAPVDIKVSGLTADSLGARRIGGLGFEAAQAYVVESVLVSDAMIAHAQGVLWNRFRLIAEPGGAAALAAVLSGVYEPPAGEHVGVLICGGNTEPAQGAAGAH